jgi:hypothetical protein
MMNYPGGRETNLKNIEQHLNSEIQSMKRIGLSAPAVTPDEKATFDKPFDC